MAGYIKYIKKLIEYVSTLQDEVQNLIAGNTALRKENKKLKAQIKRLKKGTDSTNSSKAPSSDMPSGKKKRSSSAKKKKRKRNPGGQKGHKGHHLEFRVKVDKVVNHTPSTCRRCGEDMTGTEGKTINRGQYLDLPSIELLVTEHRQIEKTCIPLKQDRLCCGHRSKGSLPGTLGYAKVQYGKRLKQFVSYLNVRQFLPMKRIGELLKTLLGVSPSTGTIHNIVQRMADELEPTYKNLFSKIRVARVVGSDETGCNVEGKQHYVWTWQNDEYVVQYASDNRGYRTVKSCFPSGLPKAVLFSDRYAAQLKTTCKAHQLCLAHLSRNCQRLIDHYKSQ